MKQFVLSTDNFTDFYAVLNWLFKWYITNSICVMTAVHRNSRCQLNTLLPCRHLNLCTKRLLPSKTYNADLILLIKCSIRIVTHANAQVFL